MKTLLAMLLLTLLPAAPVTAQTTNAFTETPLKLPPFVVRDDKLTAVQNLTALSNAVVVLRAYQSTNEILLSEIRAAHPDAIHDPERLAAENIWICGEYRKITYRHFWRDLQMEIKHHSPDTTVGITNATSIHP